MGATAFASFLFKTERGRIGERHGWPLAELGADVQHSKRPKMGCGDCSEPTRGDDTGSGGLERRQHYSTHGQLPIPTTIYTARWSFWCPWCSRWCGEVSYPRWLVRCGEELWSGWWWGRLIMHMATLPGLQQARTQGNKGAHLRSKWGRRSSAVASFARALRRRWWGWHTRNSRTRQ